MPNRVYLCDNFPSNTCSITKTVVHYLQCMSFHFIKYSRHLFSQPVNHCLLSLCSPNGTSNCESCLFEATALSLQQLENDSGYKDGTHT